MLKVFTCQLPMKTNVPQSGVRLPASQIQPLFTQPGAIRFQQMSLFLHLFSVAWILHLATEAIMEEKRDSIEGRRPNTLNKLLYCGESELNWICWTKLNELRIGFLCKLCRDSNRIINLYLRKNQIRAHLQEVGNHFPALFIVASQNPTESPIH